MLFREAVAPIYDERPELAEWVDRIRAVSPSGAVDVSLLPEITINIGHSGAPDGYADITAVRFKELVGERSSGRMSVEVYPASQIGSERDLVEGAQVGWIDAGVVPAGILEGLLPEVGVVSLPFLFDRQDHVDAVFDGPVGRELLGLAEGVGIKGLAIGQYGLRSMMNSWRSIYIPFDAAAHQRAEAAKLEAGYLAELQNRGWEVNEVDKDAFREAVAPIYDERPELSEWADRTREARSRPYLVKAVGVPSRCSDCSSPYCSLACRS